MAENVAVNTALVHLFLDHCFRLEIDAVLAMLTDDASWWVAGDPSRLRVSGLKDREQLTRMFRGVRKALPDGMAHRLIGTTAQGNRVAVEVQAEGRWVTGETYRNEYHFLIDVSGSRIYRVREYMDTLAVAALPSSLAGSSSS